MDSSNFMLSLLIPGKHSPGKDFHVFMQPLIKDMMELWKGVDTYDACKMNSNCMLRSFGPFMTILDMPLCLAVAQEAFTHVCIVMKILAMSL